MEENKKKDSIEKLYKKLLENVERSGIYDGRSKGIDVFKCTGCGERIFARYKDKGFAPGMYCSKCGHPLRYDTTMSPSSLKGSGVKVLNFVRPTLGQVLKLNHVKAKEVLRGRLMLESDIERFTVRRRDKDFESKYGIGKEMLSKMKENPL